MSCANRDTAIFLQFQWHEFHLCWQLPQVSLSMKEDYAIEALRGSQMSSSQ